MVLLLLVLLLCVEIIAMEKDSIEKSPICTVFQATHRGRIILTTTKEHEKDFKASSDNLLRTIMHRKKKDDKEFKKHHLNLLICAFHADDKKLFTELLKLSDADTECSWQDFRTEEKEDPSQEKDRGELLAKKGTLEDHVKFYCYNENKREIPHLMKYLKLVRATYKRKLIPEYAEQAD